MATLKKSPKNGSRNPIVGSGNTETKRIKKEGVAYALYKVTVYLKDGASAKVNSQAEDFTSFGEYMEKSLHQPQLVLSSHTDRAVLVIKDPGQNVIAYLIDEA